MIKSTFLKMIFIAVILIVGNEKTWGQIAAWDFNGVSTPPTTFAATTFDPNLVSINGANYITRGMNASLSTGDFSFRTIGFKNEGIKADNSDYFQITLTSVAGYVVSLATIDAKFNGTLGFYASPGVTSQFAYSLDGINFTFIEPATISTSLTLAQINLSGILALQNVSAGTIITLRYYASGQTDSGGWGFYSDKSGSNGLEINGAVNLYGSTPSTTPTFSPTAGDYASSQYIRLYSNAGSSIYYTNDGSDPNSGSTLYTGSIVLNTTALTTIKTIAYDANGLNPSRIALATYNINMNPTITTIPATVSPMIAFAGSQNVTRTINVNATNLKEDVLVTLSGANTDQFSVAPTTIAKSTDGSVSNSIVTITYKPTAIGNHTSTLTLKSFEAANVILSLSGSSTINSPIALSPIELNTTSFISNWNSVIGAVGYFVDVYTKSNCPFTENFDGFTGGTTGSGASTTDASTILDMKTQTPGWTGTKIYSAGGTIKIGTSTVVGSITSPLMDLSSNSGAFNLMFKSMAWSGDATNLKVFLNDILVNTVTGLNNDATYTLSSFSIALTGGKVNSNIRFEGSSNTNSRFFLEDLYISQGGIIKSPISNSPFSVSNSTSQVITGLEEGNTYYYTVKATDGTITSIISNEIRNKYLTATSGYNNWSSASAWMDAIIPPSGANIVVYNALTIDQDANVSSLTIHPGAKLTLNTNKTFTASILNIQSDATGTGTFVDNGSTNITTANVQQYLTGATGTSTRGWWYIASPVINATSSIFDIESGTNNLWLYDETAIPNPIYTKITTNGILLNPGVGYIASIGGADATYTFSGSLNTGDITKTTTRTGTESAKRGFNLVGNPYPCYLDWNSVIKTNVRNTIWYRTFNGINTMLFDTFDGSVGTSNGIYGLVTQYIPPMQAFWTKVNADGDKASLVFKNTMRSHKDVSNNVLRVRTTISPQVLRLKVSNGTNGDEALIVINPNASDGYDSYDSPKMSNENVVIPEIYTLADTEELVINNLNSISPNKELALGFRTGKANNFTIKATEISNFDADTRIFLRDNDNLLNPEQDLTDGIAYSFASDVATNTSRFSIIFKSASIPTGIANNLYNKEDVHIYKNANNHIVVINNGFNGKDGRIIVCNAVGHKLICLQTKGTSTVISNHFTSGIYFVTVCTKGINTTKKVIID